MIFVILKREGDILKGKFIVISGPSGVGKGTICNKLFKEINAWYSVSTTTRNPREGEVDGVNYFFVSKEEFEKKIKNGDFLEYNVYNDNYYGTSKKIVLEKMEEGINVFSEIDVNGAHNIKKIFPDALLIYIAPPSIDVLRERLIERGTEDIEKINQRLKIAEKELKEIDFYDYVVVNDDLERATKEVKNIILKEI